MKATRNPEFTGNRSYRARDLLYCYGWHDGGYQGRFLGMAPFLTSGYRPPEILRAIARNPNGGAYRTTSRRAVMIQGGSSVATFPGDGPGANAVFLDQLIG